MRVCLASTSPARLMLLRQAGIEPLTLSPEVDEDALAAAAEERMGPVAPADLVLLLARAKAAAVAERLAAEGVFDGIVIGGDSMFALGDRVYGKPYTPEEATRRWQEMCGATGVLHSGHSVFRVSPGAEPVEASAGAGGAGAAWAGSVSGAGASRRSHDPTNSTVMAIASAAFRIES